MSPLDVAGIKNVYERVWVMTHLEEEEKRRREEQLGEGHIGEEGGAMR